MSHGIDAAHIEAFNRIANDASTTIGEEIITLAEERSLVDTLLLPGSVYYAVISGAMTGALRVLKAASATGMLVDADDGFRKLLTSMTDIWGQIDGEAPAGSTVQ